MFFSTFSSGRPSLSLIHIYRTGPQLRGDAFRCQRRLKLRVKGQDSLTEVTAVRPCPALVQHIAAVSYTHLDVYKRQVLGRRWFRIDEKKRRL